MFRLYIYIYNSYLFFNIYIYVTGNIALLRSGMPPRIAMEIQCHVHLCYKSGRLAVQVEGNPGLVNIGPRSIYSISTVSCNL